MQKCSCYIHTNNINLGHNTRTLYFMHHFHAKKPKNSYYWCQNHSKCNSELIGAGIIQDSRASRDVFHYGTGGSGHSAAFTNQSFLLTCSEQTSQHTCSRINAAVSTHTHTHTIAANSMTHMFTHKCMLRTPTGSIQPRYKNDQLFKR